MVCREYKYLSCVIVLDEEIGGTEGMEAFVKSNEFKELNVGFALDEGGPTLEDTFRLFYGERNRWGKLITFRCFFFNFKMVF